ncbi:hypothetical protein [Fibrella aestuarina]|uniref:hypothetical protein n=1 Tax=Fibrella aestuarina TaxID=651143 RepID=UPI00059B9FF9|nr:hypothetical protein [Fibrella aestuarina]
MQVTSPQNLPDLEQIITLLSDEQRLDSLSRGHVSQFEATMAFKIGLLISDVTNTQYTALFRDLKTDDLRIELTEQKAFPKFYETLLDKDKRAQMLDVAKRFYRLHYEKRVAEVKTVLMTKPIATMTGEEFKLYLEIIGIIKPLWTNPDPVA